MTKTAIILGLFALAFVSCQKEIDWSENTGSQDGDLLIKALEITPSTNDTNVITFQWDPNKRLTEYKTAGKVNGINTTILYSINRLGDGKVKNIISKSSLTAGFLDSTVYNFFYTAGGQVSYVIDTQYTLIGALRDSIAFNYAGGRVSMKDTYMDIFGTLTHSTRETYSYDANGNLLADSIFTPDGSGGFDLMSVVSTTYNTHKNAVTLGEESFVVIGPTNVSRNFADKTVSDASAGGGPSYTATLSQVQYNSFDRPTQGSITVTPQPPGYNLKVLFFYQ